jgi:hypothetical protein
MPVTHLNFLSHAEHNDPLPANSHSTHLQRN